MALSSKTREFLASPEAATIREELSRMMLNPCYNTRSSYSAAVNKDILFVDKHINYLSSHLNVDPAQYMSNLKLITKYN
jgi:hypothetical protein